MPRFVPMLLLLTMLFAFHAAKADEVKLSIFHTNDLHGYSFANRLSRPGKDVEVEGLFALASIIAQRRAELWKEKPEYARAFAQKGRDDGLLLFDSGDSTSGTFDCAQSQGRNLLRLMNSTYLDYDACTIGNHAVDYGAKSFRENLALRKFPVLLANVEGQWPNVLPYLIVERMGVKIAIFGLCHPRSTWLEGLHLTDVASTCRELIPRLRQQSDIVICLAHLGLEREAAWTEALTTMDDDSPQHNIDIIIDAHSHANKHYELDDDTVVTLCGCYGIFAGEIELSYSRELGKITKYEMKRHLLAGKEAKPLPQLVRAFRPMRAQISSLRDEVLARGLGDLFIKKTPFMSPEFEDPAATFFAQALYEGVPDSDLAMLNQSGVRSVVAANDDGNVTRGLLHRIAPFDEAVYAIKLKGYRVQRLVERGLGKKFAWAGLKVKYTQVEDEEGKAQRTLDELKILSRDGQSLFPVEDNKEYVLACPEFFKRVYVRPRRKVTVAATSSKDLLLAYLRKGPSIFQRAK